jgi:hypothetical protein
MKKRSAGWSTVLLAMLPVVWAGACTSKSSGSAGPDTNFDSGTTEFDSTGSSSGGSSGGGSSSGTEGGTTTSDGGIAFLPDVTLPAPPNGPGAMAVDTSTSIAYVGVSLPGDGGNYGAIVVVDLVAGTVTTTIPIPGFQPGFYQIGAVAVDSTTHTVYVAGYSGASTFMGDSITIIDGTTNMVVPVSNTLMTGNIYPVNVQFEQHLDVDPGSKHLFGWDGNGHLAVVDAVAMAAITTVMVPGYDPAIIASGQCGLAIDPASHTVWTFGASSDDAGIATTSMLTVVDGTTNAVGTQTMYGGAPIFLADDSASTGDVFLVTQSPQSVVLDGPVTFQVPTGFTVDTVREGCAMAAATMQDASGNNFFQYFSTSTGAPVGQATQLPWPTSEQAIAEVAYGTSGGSLVIMMNVNIGGSTSVLPTLRRIKGC